MELRARNQLKGTVARVTLGAVRADVAADIGDRLHPLVGNLQGYWSVRVPGHWRIVFRCNDGEAFDVDLIDCH